MMSALHKVPVPLSERYETKCASCGWDRHFFGTEKEARESALKMGWEFRMDGLRRLPMMHQAPVYHEQAYCPHCKLLVKA